jgi:murein L,D-transpeptidase YcbB/YkuD
MGPDPENPLGRVKFMLPNRHQVYLHDTPSRDLFARRDRAASSGCIRLEDPLGLAELLLEGQIMPPPALPDSVASGSVPPEPPPGERAPWQRAAVDSVIAGGQTVTVPLRRRPQVLILYLTAWQDHDGCAQFREDLYGRDAAVVEALAESFAGVE